MAFILLLDYPIGYAVIAPQTREVFIVFILPLDTCG